MKNDFLDAVCLISLGSFGGILIAAQLDRWIGYGQFIVVSVSALLFLGLMLVIRLRTLQHHSEMREMEQYQQYQAGQREAAAYFDSVLTTQQQHRKPSSNGSIRLFKPETENGSEDNRTS